MKRFFDFSLALISLLVLSPILLLVCILIKIDSTGPIFFQQLRLGKNQTSFTLLKFRTMTDKKRLSHRQIFEGDAEITKIGSFLRRSKIDELPQLINVILGNMSIVGPRPCLPEVKGRFGKYSNSRFFVKPGLTSLAAVKGSIYLSWNQKGIYDYIYVENLSFLLDCYIIYKTFQVVILGEKRMFIDHRNKQNDGY